ncbi:MAG: radical SAM protein [Deltaproteobacteria bacterium]|nr:radical SAM protein [Deltaproteobacteria bacterium]
MVSSSPPGSGFDARVDARARPPSGGSLWNRYLAPARVVPLTSRGLARVAHTLRATWRAHPVAGAAPAALGIDVSDVCDLACAVCSRVIHRDPRAVPVLDLERFRAIYDRARPAYLLLSGYGEPLLAPDLPRMVAHAAADGAVSTVITNGMHLDGDRARQLLDAGLAKVKVSIDAADPESYQRLRSGGDFHRVLANVRAFLDLRDRHPRARAQVEVQAVLCKENLDQALGIARLCRERLPGVDLNFLSMFTYGNQPGFVERALPRWNEPRAAEVASEIRRVRAACAAWGFRRACGSLDAIEVQLTRDLSGAPCFMPWYQALVATDGRLYPCCHHSVHGTPVGNVLESDFVEVWDGPAMQTFRRRLLERRASDPVCAACCYEDRILARLFGWIPHVPARERP